MDLKYNVVLFDFDGTVMDSGPGIIRCAKETVEELGLCMPEETVFRKFIGPPLKVSFQQTFDLTDEEAQRAVDVYRRRYHDSRGLVEGKIYEGIVPLLGQLADAGAVLAVASAKREVTVRETLVHFGLARRFKAICGAPMTMKIADKPAIMRDCLRRLSANPGDAVMIGDSGYDAEASQELGVDFCAAMWGYGFDSLDDLKSYQCRYVAQDVASLGRFLLGESFLGVPDEGG